MFDRWEYVAPADKTEAEAEKVVCKLSPGLLQQLRIFIPQGSKKYVRCRVFLGEKPIAPRSKGQYLSGEGFVVDLQDLREPIKEDLPVLNWFVWNTDATYPHTPWMSAAWLSIDVPYEKELLEEMKDFINIFKQMTGMR